MVCNLFSKVCISSLVFSSVVKVAFIPLPTPTSKCLHSSIQLILLLLYHEPRNKTKLKQNMNQLKSQLPEGKVKGVSGQSTSQNKEGA